jgi:hypothetical protein
LKHCCHTSRFIRQEFFLTHPAIDLSMPAVHASRHTRRRSRQMRMGITT